MPTSPTPVELAGAAVISLTTGAAFYATLSYFLPTTQPDIDILAQCIMGGITGAGISLVFLCPAILGWHRDDGEWVQLDKTKRWVFAIAAVIFLALTLSLMIFYEIDPV